MPNRSTTLMDPPIESLLDKVDSKFTLVVVVAKRARQVNTYFNHLGEGPGRMVPPQVPTLSGKPLTIAFAEVSAGKAAFVRIAPGDAGVDAPGDTGVDAPGDTASAMSGEVGVFAGAERGGDEREG